MSELPQLPEMIRQYGVATPSSLMQADDGLLRKSPETPIKPRDGVGFVLEIVEMPNTRLTQTQSRKRY